MLANLNELLNKAMLQRKRLCNAFTAKTLFSLNNFLLESLMFLCTFQVRMKYFQQQLKIIFNFGSEQINTQKQNQNQHEFFL